MLRGRLLPVPGTAPLFVPPRLLGQDGDLPRQGRSFGGSGTKGRKRESRILCHARKGHASVHSAAKNPRLLRPRVSAVREHALSSRSPARSSAVSSEASVLFTKRPAPCPRLFRETPPFVLPFLPNGSNVWAPLRLFMRSYHVYRTGNVWTSFFSPFCSWRQARC